MTIPTFNKQVLALYLSLHCRGRENAKKVPDLAAALGWRPRYCQHVVHALRLENGRVGSTCSKPAGVYWILTEAEAQEVAAELESRIKHISRSWAAITRAWPHLGQGRLLDI